MPGVIAALDPIAPIGRPDPVVSFAPFTPSATHGPSCAGASGDPAAAALAVPVALAPAKSSIG